MSRPTRQPIIEEDIQNIVRLELPWSDFSGNTVLISGANGFLPAYMVETLLYLNERHPGPPTKVIGIVRNRERAEERFAAYRGRSDLQIVVQDVCEPIALMEQIDFVIHAASQASPKFYGIDPVGTLLANTTGTDNLLRLARRHGAKRFLYFSSSEVYGRVDPRSGSISEDDYGYLDPTKVRSCYAESKRMGETMCMSWHSQFGIPTVIVRPFHTYGPGMRLDDGRVCADFVADVLHKRDILMQSDGRAIRAFCYLSDAVAGFFTVLLKGTTGGVYNIGNDQGEMAVEDLAELLVGLKPEQGLKVVRQKHSAKPGYIPNLVTRICPDISRTRGLGWRPMIGVRQGFARTLGSYA